MFLALAEIRRSLGRFALLGGAIGLLVLLLLFFQAVAGALTAGLTGAFEAADADVWVYDDAARRNPQASVLPDDAAETVAAVDGVERAGAVTFTVFDVGDEPTAVVAVDPDSPALPTELTSGSTIASSGDAVLAASGFVTAPPTDDLDLAGIPVDVVGEAEAATFNVLPTLFTTRDVVADATVERAGAPVPFPTSAIAVAAADGVGPGHPGRRHHGTGRRGRGGRRGHGHHQPAGCRHHHPILLDPLCPAVPGGGHRDRGVLPDPDRAEA